MSGVGEQQLIQAAVAGDAAAQFELAMHFANQRDARALEWMSRAANAGLSLAQAQLGVWELMGLFGMRDPRRGLEQIQAAARSGDDIACLLHAGLSAMGTLAPHDWNAARDWLIEAAWLGNDRALTQISLLLPPSFKGRGGFAQRAARAGYPPAQEFVDGNEDADLDRASAALDLAGLAAPGESRTESETPRILFAPQFLPEAWCRYIRALAEPSLLPSTVHNAELGKAVLGVRTSAHTAFGAVDSDPLLAIVSHRIAAWTGTQTACGEDTTILRYRPGEEYKRHVDFFDPALPTIWAEAERAGQRTVTVLIWLNDDYEGGETEFPLIGRSFRGRTGDALAFWNTLADGAPDRRTVHAGLPPRGGDKWLISKWTRDRPQNA